MSKQAKAGKGSPKGSKFGGKQKNGHSRAAYFAIASARIAANKAKRIAKEAKRQAI